MLNLPAPGWCPTGLGTWDFLHLDLTFLITPPNSCLQLSRTCSSLFPTIPTNERTKQASKSSGKKSGFHSCPCLSPLPPSIPIASSPFSWPPLLPSLDYVLPTVQAAFGSQLCNSRDLSKNTGWDMKFHQQESVGVEGDGETSKETGGRFPGRTCLQFYRTCSCLTLWTMRLVPWLF